MRPLILPLVLLTTAAIASFPIASQAAEAPRTNAEVKQGQVQTRKCPLPEFNDKPAFCSQDKSSLVELEKSQYQPMSRPEGFVSVVAGYHLGGATSNVRVKSSTDLEFVIKVSPGTDPTSVVDLLAFTTEDGERIIITTKTSKFDGSKATIVKIPYQVKKIADGVYVLSVSNLKPGEYFFGGTDSMFAFGIDG